MPNLPIQYHIAYIVPKMKNHSLISICKLCAAGCLFQFIDSEFTVYFNNKVGLQVNKNVAKNLLIVPTTKTNTKIAISPTPNMITPDIPHPPKSVHVFSNLFYSAYNIKIIYSNLISSSIGTNFFLIR